MYNYPVNSFELQMKMHIENCIEKISKTVHVLYGRSDSMRKRFPSQIRYEEKNPLISFRLKKDEKSKINLMADRSDKKVSELVRMALLDLEKDFTATYEKISHQENRSGFNLGQTQGYEKGYDEGYDEGYEKGKSDWVVWGYCDHCGKLVFIEPNSNNHECMIDRMRGYLMHKTCYHD